MKVTLINEEEIKNIFKNWGQTSAICYNSNGDPEKIGKNCLKSGHFSGSRGDYFKFLVEDIPRFLIDQAVRHEVGTFKNVQSFRYVDKSTFAYDVPDGLNANSKLLNEYICHMKETEKLYGKIQDYLRSAGKTKEEANEQARYVLPMATKSAFIIGFDIEALINFMHKRLCNRAEAPIRELAEEMRKQIINVIPELDDYLVPSCDYLNWCPEGKHGCGKYMTKQELMKVVENSIYGH